MKGLLELIKLIFGPKALSKTIGTRTNVIQLPNNKTKRYLKQDLNIEAASDAAAMNAKKEMEELVAEIPKMNDAERLIFEGNLRRLKNRLGLRSETDPTADVFQFGTKEKVTPGGIASLTEKAGQKSPPGTLMGNIESRIKQLEASGEDLSKMKGQTLDEIMGDVASSQQGMRQLEKQGLVRATARDIITTDIKSGKLKLPKELEKQILEGGGEPIDVLRNVYGEDALEVLDSLIPEFSKLRTSTEAEKLARSKFKFEPDVNRPKGSMSPEEAAKAEQENILTPGKTIPADSPEGKKITEALIGKPKAEVVSLPTAEKILSDMRNLGPIDAMKEANKVLKKEGPYKNLTDKDIEKIMDDINDHIFGGDLPVDPEDFATGGRVGFMDGGSKGLDYLMGIERRGYQEGSVSQEGVIPGFTRLINPNGAPGNYNEFMYEGSDGQIYGAGTYSSIAAGQYPNIYDPSKNTQTTPTNYFNNNPGGLSPEGYIMAPDGKFYKTDSLASLEAARERLNQVREEGDPYFNDQYQLDHDLVNYGMDPQNFNIPQTSTPTEDFSDYLNQSTDATEKPLTEYEQYVLRTQGVPVSEEVFNATKQLAPDGDIAAAGFTSDQEFFKARNELADQMISPEDALTPEVPQVNPIQEHIDFNEFLKGQGLSQQDYNVLGGYDVKEKLAPGNPILGGAINLASPVYNALQMFDSAKDAQGNVIKQYVPDMYEDATESGAYYAVPAQKISDIPGSAARNIQGGLGLLSDRQKQSYQDIRNQYETQRQQYETQRQQDLENYRQRQAAVDPNQVRQNYLQNLQNTGTTNVGEFQSKLQSNLMSNPNLANGGRVGFANGGSTGLDYLMGINRQGYATGSTNPFYSTYSGLPINMNILPSSANNPFYPSFFENDTFQKYKSYLNQLQSKDPLSSEILYSQPNTYVASSGDGGNDDSQTSTTSGSGTSIGNAISNAIGSMTPGRAIGTAIGYGIAGPIGGYVGGKIGSSVGGGDSGTSGTTGTPGPGDTGGAGGDPGDPGSEAGGTGTDADGNDTSPGATGGAGGESGSGGSGGGGKIVCTMMNESYGFGSFRNKIWLKHSKGLAPEYQKGYHKIFLPLVTYAKQDGISNKIIKNILEHIAVHRTIDIRQESKNKIHLLGRIYRKILEPMCYLVGKNSQKRK